MSPGSQAAVMAPRISFPNAPKIAVKSKFLFQRFKGPQFLADGSVNKLRITKEEQAIKKY